MPDVSLNQIRMNTKLHPASDGVNMLMVRGVTVNDLKDVDAWLFAIDLSPNERRAACQQLLSDGSFSVCNIEHRVEVHCTI